MMSATYSDSGMTSLESEGSTNSSPKKRQRVEASTILSRMNQASLRGGSLRPSERSHSPVTGSDEEEDYEGYYHDDENEDDEEEERNENNRMQYSYYSRGQSYGSAHEVRVHQYNRK